MTDHYLPGDISPSEVRWGAIDSTSVYASDTTGAIRSSAIVGGNVLNPTFVWPPLKDQSSTERQRSRLIAAFRALRGQANRIWMPVPGHEEPSWAPEVLSNNTFASGTTGWSAQQATLTVVDRVMRVTVAKNIASGPPAFNATSNPTVTAYVPYVLRSILAGRSRSGLNAGTYTNSVANYSADAQGLITQMVVPMTTSLGPTYPAVYDSAENITLTGDWLECPWCSLARCALVDNGANLLLQSDDFTTTWANTRSTDAANSTTAPDGTSTADSIIEDATASNTHYIGQGVTVASTTNLDYAFTVCLKAGTRSFAQIAMIESTSSHEAYVDVNLTTGALGTATASGANWTNPRAFSRDMGDGWWAVTIIGRKASAGTTLTARVNLASALGTVSYNGNGTSLIYAWRGTLTQSSVPTRLVATTTTAASGSTQSGTGLYIKGLPASTNDLRKAGHWIQIGRELHQLAAPLNSDAAGMAFMQLCNPPRTAPANDEPVIFNNPMGKFLQAKNVFSWKDMPGLFSDFEVEFLEATAG